MASQGDKRLSGKSTEAPSSPQFDVSKQQARLAQWGKSDHRDLKTVANRQGNRDKLAKLAGSFLEKGSSQNNTYTARSSDLPPHQTGTSKRKNASFAARMMQLEEEMDERDIRPGANDELRGRFGMNETRNRNE